MEPAFRSHPHTTTHTHTQSSQTTPLPVHTAHTTYGAITTIKTVDGSPQSSPIAHARLHQVRQRRTSRAGLFQMDERTFYRTPMVQDALHAHTSLTPLRFWYLLAFCLLSMQNAMVSMTFNALPEEAIQYYHPHWTMGDLNLLLIINSVAGVVCTLPAGALAYSKSGLRHAMVLVKMLRSACLEEKGEKGK